MKIGLLGEKEIRSVKWKIAIDFISRDLMEALDAVLLAGVKQNTHTYYVSLKEEFRCFDRAVNMAFSCEVDDNIRLVFSE